MNDDCDRVAWVGGPRMWLAWSTAAAGFLALAASFGLSLAHASAEPVGRAFDGGATAPLDGDPSAARLLEGGAEDAPLVAIVIDDVGLDPVATARAIGLPARVSLALLPYAPRISEIDAEARAAGHETLVHLPMEPSGFADPGPDALTTWLTPQAVRDYAEEAFAQAPGARGVNNHMGSRFTACAPCIAPVAEAAAAHGLFVLDSLTTPDSRFADEAGRAGTQAIRRDVFLDNVADEEVVLAALRRAEGIATRRGDAVAIGHPHDATLSALERWVPEAQARGVAVGRVGDALERRALAEETFVAHARP